MQRTVTVTGHGVATAVPDRAVVRLAATSHGGSVAEAVAGLSSVGEAAAEVARSHARPGQVSTNGLQVWPRHDNEGRPTGFEATHQLRVVCDSLDDASAMLAGLVDRVGDALRVEGVGLEVSDPSEALVRAREAAYADARERAEHLAGLGGRRLGDLLAVQEGEPLGSGPLPGARMALAAAEVRLEAGEQEVRCQVGATWQLV